MRFNVCSPLSFSTEVCHWSSCQSQTLCIEEAEEDRKLCICFWKPQQQLSPCFNVTLINCGSSLLIGFGKRNLTSLTDIFLKSQFTSPRGLTSSSTASRKARNEKANWSLFSAFDNQLVAEKLIRLQSVYLRTPISHIGHIGHTGHIGFIFPQCIFSKSRRVHQHRASLPNWAPSSALVVCLEPAQGEIEWRTGTSRTVESKSSWTICRPWSCSCRPTLYSNFIL